MNDENYLNSSKSSFMTFFGIIYLVNNSRTTVGISPVGLVARHDLPQKYFLFRKSDLIENAVIDVVCTRIMLHSW